MSTNADNRAARRSASTAARRAAADPERQAPQVFATDDPADGPESPVAASESPENPEGGTPPHRMVNLSVLREQRAKTGQAPGRPAGALALPDEDRSRQIDQSDLIMPKLRISQAMSEVNRLFSASRGKSGVAMGSWYHSTTGRDLGDTVYFVPVDMRKSRSMFLQGQGLVCRSFDMLQGEGDPGILCEGTLEERQLYKENERGCALRLWNREDGKNVPPACGETYNYPGLIITDIEHPDTCEVLQAMLQLRSNGIVAAKSINTHVFNFGDGVWSNVIIELGVQEKTNTKGTFFVPVAELFDRADAPQYAKILRRAQSFAKAVGSVDLRTTIESDGEIGAE